MTPLINKKGDGVSVLTGKEVQKYYIKQVAEKWFIDEQFLNEADILKISFK